MGKYLIVYAFLLWFEGEKKMNNKMFNFKCGMFEMPRNNNSKHLYGNHYKM